MISFFLIVCLFTFVSCKSFHPNQHLPVQKYDQPFRYQPFQYYPSAAPTLPFYRPSPTKEGIAEGSSEQQQLSDLERQYQQWQIAVSNGQQPGVVWISAPQYSYYPPSGGNPTNYPPPPYYPPQPYPPYPLPAPESNNTQQQIQEINPTQARETTKPNPPETTAIGSTTPSENITLSPIETVPTSSPVTFSSTTEGATSPSVESTTIFSTTTPQVDITSTTARVNVTATTPRENITTTTPRENITTTTPRVSVTTTEFTTNATTEIPTTEYTTQGTSPTTTQNSTSIETTTAPQNTTSNSTNPLLKYCKKPRGQFPGEGCDKFVNCWDDTAVEQACPSGLYFNANKSYCDYPENVECSGSPSSTESSTSSSSVSNTTTSSKCPSSYGTYRNTSNCAAFYVCVAGEPVDFYCPPGTNYNDELKVCDYPYRVNCSGIPSLPIPEESSTTIVTETTPSNSTTESSSTTPVSSSTPIYTTESSSVNASTTSSSSSTETSTATESVNNRTTTEPITSTIPPPQVTEEPIPSIPPPSVDPVALYNFNLKKLPESVVNTGVRCYHTNIFRLTPDCSSVTVCQDGLTYIVNCGQGTSFDAFSQKCVSSFRARC